MQFFNWGLFKKLSFFTTGAGIGANLATTEAYVDLATTGNLVAIAGGSAYSIFKNLEIASEIAGKKKNCFYILDEMCSWAETDSTEELLDRLGIVREEAQRVLKQIDTINDSVKQSYIYAGINATVQAILGAISVGLNAAASQEDNDNIWDSVSVMNMFLTGILIISQYFIHSALARRLRALDDKSKELKRDIEKLNDSVQAQVLKLENLVHRINDKYQHLLELDTGIRVDSTVMLANQKEMQGIHNQVISPIMESEIEKRVTELSMQIEKLKQRIASNNHDKQRFVTELQELLSKTSSTIETLRAGFSQHQQFDNLSARIEEIRPQLDLEIVEPSFS